MKEKKRKEKKIYYCRYCESKENTFRIYIRTRKLKSRILHIYNQEKRRFKAIGWYCEHCKKFETEEMINHRNK